MLTTPTHIRVRLYATCAAFLFAVVAFAGDQAQFGHAWTRNMVSGETNLPTSFDTTKGSHIKWVANLGSDTHSTPVVAGGRVYIGTNNADPRSPLHQGDRGVLMCFDEKDGHLLWQLVVPKLTNSMYWDWPKAGICSTMTVENGRVYLVSNRGEVMCLDAQGMANGNDGPFKEEGRHCSPAGSPPVDPGLNDADILWLFDMPRQLGVRQHDSAHASVLIQGQYVYVNTSNGVDDSHKRIDAPDAPSLIALDKDTGRLVAQDAERIGPRIFHSTWSSPAVAEVAQSRQIIFGGGDGVIYAFEPIAERKSLSSNAPIHFKKLWQFDCDPTGPKQDVSRYLGNRKESPSTIQSMPVFCDGKLYITVGGDLWWGKRQAWLKCINPDGSGDITRSNELWSRPLIRHAMSTPAVRNGLVFVADCGKTIHCMDANSGESYWSHQTEGEIWGSTLVADGKVYVGTRKGEFLVFSAERSKRLLSQTQLEKPISATPVAANGVLYVATMDRLYAVR